MFFVLCGVYVWTTKLVHDDKKNIAARPRKESVPGKWTGNRENHVFRPFSKSWFTHTSQAFFNPSFPTICYISGEYINEIILIDATFFLKQLTGSSMLVFRQLFLSYAWLQCFW